MIQLLQNTKTGELSIEEVPPPMLRPGCVLVRTSHSVISAGTERQVITEGQKGLLQKALEKPEKVRKVLRAARREGFLSTYQQVQANREGFIALGYSSSGTVIEVAEDVEGLQRGDRVALAGAGYASHAEVVCVPVNLSARVPDGVSLEAASFTTLGAIALQGVRQAEVQLGERVVVIGLGLIGQLSVALLRAAGCRVLGVDIDPRTVPLARSMGADDAVAGESEAVRAAVRAFASGMGADAVLIAASSLSNEPIEMAAQVARDRARVVVIGATRLDVPRDAFYQKELDLRLSRSYGPGRYDPLYEEAGIDYPAGYVRWTEKRNLEAFLDLIAQQRIDLEPVITHRFPFAQARAAYDVVLGKSAERALGVVLQYDTHADVQARVEFEHAALPLGDGQVGVSLIGAGRFARGRLLPALAQIPDVAFRGVSSLSGVSAKHAADRFKFAFAGGINEALTDTQTHAIIIATRHDTHASLAAEAIAAGKQVFVEKPLALDESGLRQIVKAARKHARAPMVGFNRRFSPLGIETKSFFRGRKAPMIVTCRVNAEHLDRSHWVHGTEGGGRVIGEACHFIDLIQFFTGAEPQRVFAQAICSGGQLHDDYSNFSLTLAMSDGSVGVIVYQTVGNSSLAKERIEVSADGRSAIIDDFRSSTLYDHGGTRLVKGKTQDKGHLEELRQFISAVRQGAPMPISLRSSVATTLATFAAERSLRTGEPADIAVDAFLADAG